MRPGRDHSPAARQAAPRLALLALFPLLALLLAFAAPSSGGADAHRLRVREYHEVGSFGWGETGSRWHIVRITEPNGGGAIRPVVLLRIEIARTGKGHGQAHVGAMGAEDALRLPGVLQRLHALWKGLLKDGPYTEADHQLGDARIGFYRESNDTRFFIRVGTADEAAVVIPPGELPRLHELADRAAAKVRELWR